MKHAERQSETFIPERVPANPKLAALTNDWKPANVYHINECIHVAVGYGRTNTVLIEGEDGLIIVDPGESQDAATIVKAEFNERLKNIFVHKPVKAIIYTHYHECHIHGASVFAGTDTPDILCHEHLPHNLFTPPGALYCPAYPIKAYRAIKYMGLLYQENPGYFVNGGIFPFSVPGGSGYLPPTKTVKDQEAFTIAGVRLDLIHAPGETSDIIVVWLPDMKVLVQIGDFYKSFPAITTLRGASFRNPLDYIESIDTMRRLDIEHLILTHGGEPLHGKEHIRNTLTNARDANQFIHDQTLQHMNKGLTPGEIIDVVTLPPHLADDPYVQEYFGDIDRNIFQIFSQYLGWFSGKSRDLFPISAKEKARASVELAGGIEQLAENARNALKNGKAKWALIFADDVLLLDPKHDAARKIKSSAMIQLAGETYNAQTRNYLLSEYLEETGQLSFSIPDYSKIDDHLVSFMPITTVFDMMAINLNASKSLEREIIVGLRLTTESGDYSMQVRRGILDVQPQFPVHPKFTVTTESLIWKNVVLGKIDPKSAVEKEKIVISGGTPGEFYDFMHLFSASEEL